MHSGVRKRTSLRDGLVLEVYRSLVGEGIVAWIVVVIVAADIRPEVEDRGVTDRVRISRRDVEGADLRTLIGIADVAEDRICARSVADHVLHIQIVVGVRCLKPRATVVQVEVNGIHRCKLAIDAVEDVKFVAFVVKDHELRWIEKTACVKTIDLNKVAPVFSAVAQIDSACG